MNGANKMDKTKLLLICLNEMKLIDEKHDILLKELVSKHTTLSMAEINDYAEKSQYMVGRRGGISRIMNLIMDMD